MKKINITIGRSLKGGVDSQVYSGNLAENKVVIKHTKDRDPSNSQPPFSEVDFFVSRKNHNLDTYILNKLKESSVKVPEVFLHFPKITTTVLEDLRSSGFKLMLNEILAGSLDVVTGKKLGKKLAELILISRNWEKFKCYKNPCSQIIERGLELRLSYPNTQKEYLALRKRYIKNTKYWMWPDSHPKNIFVNNKTGEVAFIDFGGSYWGDQDFMLPNFIGQFLIYVIGRYIKLEFAVDYIGNMLQSYCKEIKINEALCCKYIGMEILHRANGKWIIGVNTVEHKILNQQVGMLIFEEKITKINRIFKLIQRVLENTNQ